MVTPYQLRRPELTLARAITTILDACADVAALAPHNRAFEFRAKMLALLPTDARDRGEYWEPPEDATLDDWARLGSFLGAIDGRSGYSGRLRNITDPKQLAVWSAAYSTAYFVASQGAEVQQYNGVRHG